MENDFQRNRPGGDGSPEEGWLTPFGAAGLACAGARVLVPGHLDGELSEAQAKELRAHLMDCGDCRGVLKQETNLRRWFQEGRPRTAVVPEGFAARVARRAWCDDPGIDSPEGGGAVSEGSLDRPISASRGRAAASAGASPEPRRGALLSFLLASTAAAALALFSFAVLLQRETLPQGQRLEALDYVAPWERGATQADFPPAASLRGGQARVGADGDSPHPGSETRRGTGSTEAPEEAPEKAPRGRSDGLPGRVAPPRGD